MFYFLVLVLAAVDMALYNTLGVPADASLEAITKAHRRLALINHPDKHGNSPASTAKIQELNHAKDVLSNAQMREIYDRTGNRNPNQPQSAPDPRDVKKTKAQQAKEAFTKAQTAAKEKLTKIKTSAKEGLQKAGTATKEKLTKLHTNTKAGLTSLKTKVAESKVGIKTKEGFRNLKSFSSKQFEAASKASQPFREKAANFGAQTKEAFVKTSSGFASSTREAASRFKSTFTKTGPAGQAPKPQARAH